MKNVMNLFVLLFFILMFPLLGLFVMLCLDFFGLVFKSVNRCIDNLTVLHFDKKVTDYYLICMIPTLHHHALAWRSCCVGEKGRSHCPLRAHS